MICNDCKVAGFINEEASLSQAVSPQVMEDMLNLARSWHKKCLSWRGRNKHGCTCQHKVGNVIDQSKVSLEARRQLHESRKAQFGSIVGEIA